MLPSSPIQPACMPAPTRDSRNAIATAGCRYRSIVWRDAVLNRTNAPFGVPDITNDIMSPAAVASSMVSAPGLHVRISSLRSATSAAVKAVLGLDTSFSIDLIGVDDGDVLRVARKAPAAEMPDGGWGGRAAVPDRGVLPPNHAAKTAPDSGAVLPVLAEPAACPAESRGSAAGCLFHHRSKKFDLVPAPAAVSPRGNLVRRPFLTPPSRRTFFDDLPPLLAGFAGKRGARCPEQAARRNQTRGAA